MKKEIDPTLAMGAIIVIVIIAGVAVWAGTSAQRGNKQPPGMPPEVAAEFQKRMQGANMGVSGPGGSGTVRTAGQ